MADRSTSRSLIFVSIPFDVPVPMSRVDGRFEIFESIVSSSVNLGVLDSLRALRSLDGAAAGSLLGVLSAAQFPCSIPSR